MIINGNSTHFARVKGSPGDQVLNTAQSVPSNRHCVSGLPLEWGGAKSWIYLCVCVYNVDVCDHAHAIVCMWRLEDNSGISDAMLEPYESWRLNSGLVASTFTQRAMALACTCVLT